MFNESIIICSQCFLIRPNWNKTNKNKFPTLIVQNGYCWKLALSQHMANDCIFHNTNKIFSYLGVTHCQRHIILKGHSFPFLGIFLFPAEVMETQYCPMLRYELAYSNSHFGLLLWGGCFCCLFIRVWLYTKYCEHDNWFSSIITQLQ